MGSRYGRNQKRRHRARIAQLEEGLDQHKRRTDRAASIGRALDEKLRRLIKTIRTVVPGSALLPPRTTRRDPRPYWQRDVLRPVGLVSIRFDELPIRTIERTTLALRIDAVEAVIRDNPEDFTKILHVLIRFPDGLQKYALTVGAAEFFDALPEVQEHVADTVVVEFARHAKEQRRVGHRHPAL